jgi:capsule polysaccharide modification protein KpsS
MYVNEANLVEAISKSLPISWKLYVKEHQAMVGRRKMEFYKKIKKFHNVKIVKSNFYKDPKPWIEKSLGVVTITGTTAFEASMLNKPAIVFGNVFYNVIPGIKVATCFEDLENLFKIIETDKWPKDNTLDCAGLHKNCKRNWNKF